MSPVLAVVVVAAGDAAGAVDGAVASRLVVCSDFAQPMSNIADKTKNVSRMFDL